MLRFIDLGKGRPGAGESWRTQAPRRRRHPEVPTILAFIFLGAALVAVILAVAAKPATTPASTEPAQT